MAHITRDRRRIGLAACVLVLTAWVTQVHGQNRPTAGKQTYQTRPIHIAQNPPPLPPFEPPAASDETRAGAPPRSGTEGDPAEDELLPLPQLEAPSADEITVDESGNVTGFGGEAPFGLEEGVDDLDLPNLDEPAPIYSTGTWFFRGNWYSQSDVLVYSRDEPRTVIIAKTPGNLTNNNDVEDFGWITVVDNGANFIGAADVKMRASTGARLGLGRLLGRDAGHRDHYFNFQFTGFLEWDAEMTTEAPGNSVLITTLDDTGTTPGFDGARTHIYRARSDYNSFALSYNVRSRPGRDQMALQPDGSWVRFKNSGQVHSISYGLRGFSMNEAVQFIGINDRGAVPIIGDYRVNTNNDVIGPQLGGDLVETYDQWCWGLWGNTGALVNFVQRRNVLITLNDGQPERTETINDEQLTLLGEAGLFVGYQLRPNLTLRGGGEIVYATGVSLAPENMSLTPAFTQLNATGKMFYQGASLGLDWVW